MIDPKALKDKIFKLHGEAWYARERAADFMRVDHEKIAAYRGYMDACNAISDWVCANDK